MRIRAIGRGPRASEARTRMTAYAKANGFGEASITFRIKDWGISRQRYWGTPIPIIHCPKCGMIPVPEKDLPVVLPLDVTITGQGKFAARNRWNRSSMFRARSAADTARRESDTMDTFVDSSWYFYRYCDPHNDKAPFDSAAHRTLVSDRSIHRRRRTRDPASDLFALLDEDDARSWV